jgi:hypothetical protein
MTWILNDFVRILDAAGFFLRIVQMKFSFIEQRIVKMKVQFCTYLEFKTYSFWHWVDFVGELDSV